MTEPIVRTDPLGGSPLARAAMDGHLGDWYPPVPRSVHGWKALAEAVRASMGRDWLDVIGPALAPSGAAATRLTRVAAGRGIVVTTGQQPGLFGGPIYTWSKALSALALADEIEAVTGIPAAPVFWAANDDADFAEASWTAVAIAGGAQRLTVPAGAPIGRTMADMPLGDVAPALAALVSACGATLDARPIEVARDAYREGATVGGAYLSLVRQLFEPFGIAVLDAAHDRFAEVARPFLVRALDRASIVADALHKRQDAIRAAGFTPQVAEVPGLSLVFERARDGGDKRRIPLPEATAVAAQGEGGRRGILSPNVLLRPVVERAILPTVAYVAGPGEFAYFAQVSAVASALELDAPMAVPRWSTTILEPHVVRILSRLGVDEAELAEPHRAEGRLAREAVPPALSRALSDFHRELGRHCSAVSSALEGSDLPLSPRVIDGAQRSIRHRLERLERRIVAAAKRREADTMTQIATARGALFPLGTRQERALNILPFLARHGAVITDRMIGAARAHARGLVTGNRSATTAERAPSASHASSSDPGASVNRAESARAADG
jgi:uncharacterized protein YllA (UPF0747 family)